MTVRALRPGDETIVHELQSLLPVSDPDIVGPACEGPLYGALAIDGSPVGYAIATPGPVATLLEIAVNPEYRRRGHGRQLVENIATRVDPKELVVTTPADDERTHTFYRSVGFERDGLVPDFYDDGDGLRFRRCS